MALAKVIIDRSITHGPFVVHYELDGAVQDVVTAIANLGAAVDQAKTFIAAAPGTVQKVTINTVLS